MTQKQCKNGFQLQDMWTRIDWSVSNFSVTIFKSGYDVSLPIFFDNNDDVREAESISHLF